MYIINSNLVFSKQIGEISNEKLNELKKAFSNYPEIITQQGQPLVFKKGVNAIVVQGNQIAFVSQGEPNEIDIEYMVNELIKVNSILNLPMESGLSLSFEAIENYDFSIMKKSGEKFQNAIEKLDAVGVGQRFIINNDKINGDVYIEPYVKDINKAFFNVNLQTKNIISTDKSYDLLKELFDFAVTNVEKVADELYKK